MQFVKEDPAQRFGVKIGYVLAYFVFTSILYLILTVTGKLPAPWNYLYIMATTLIVAVAGALIRMRI